MGRKELGGVSPPLDSLDPRSAFGHGLPKSMIPWLETRPPAQFGRFAMSASQSHGEVAKRLGPPPLTGEDPGWIPYCLPSILQDIMGGTIE
jgi:hypothetical protein